MSNLKDQLPAHLHPKSDGDGIQVAIEENPHRELSPADLNHAFQTLGLVNLNSEKAQALRKLGVAVKQNGILETITGGVMIMMHNLIDISTKVRNQSEGEDVAIKTVLECAKSQGYLAGAFAKVQAATLKGENRAVEKAMEQDRARRRSFPGGNKVIDVTPVPIKPASSF